MLAGLLAALLVGCGGPAATLVPSSTAAPTLAPTPAPTVAPTPAPSIPSDDLASLAGEHPEIPPGTWRWTRFDPAIAMTVDGGWTIGHRHDEFFDIFRGVTFPAIGFARFDEVYTGASTRTEATDPDAVIAALSSNPAVDLEDLGAVTLAGLEGRTIEVRVTTEQTHLFRGRGDMNADPGFVIRYHVLAAPGGGVVLVSVVTLDGELDAALPLVEPVLASLRLAEDQPG